MKKIIEWYNKESLVKKIAWAAIGVALVPLAAVGAVFKSTGVFTAAVMIGIAGVVTLAVAHIAKK